MSQDPKGFAAGDTNLYRYVGNSPTTLTDPTGKVILPPLLLVPQLMPVKGPPESTGNGGQLGGDPPVIFPQIPQITEPNPTYPIYYVTPTEPVLYPGWIWYYQHEWNFGWRPPTLQRPPRRPILYQLLNPDRRRFLFQSNP